MAFTPLRAVAMRELYSRGASTREIARVFGASLFAVNQIVKNRRHKEAEGLLFLAGSGIVRKQGRAYARHHLPNL